MSISTFLDGRIVLHHGDSRDVLKTLPSESIDSVVTDPPYALVSIVKRFGADAAAPSCGGDVYARASAGFMGQRWDTGETAFDPEFWREVLRVLKPGGHLIAAGGTRTFHRLASAIEDAGFEIRDMISWLYGSGFPKSHDVSKGIDRHNGDQRPVIGVETLSNDIRGGALLDVAHGVERPAFEREVTSAASAASAAWEGWGTALKPACEPCVLARKPLAGTVAANVLAYGTGALNIDGCRIDSEKLVGWAGAGAGAGGNTWHEDNMGLGKDGNPRPVAGRWPANVIHDGSADVVNGFPENAGGSGIASGPSLRGKNNSVARGTFNGLPANIDPAFYGDKGSASRFFYTAKANIRDRAGSKHPTVKPIDLMQYLCRLITPPGGIVLDPFAGSGTLGEAAWREGFSAILIEREADYVADISARIDQLSMGPASRAADIAKRRSKSDRSNFGPLFGEEVA
jgi:site-specific DNA-methyltransferase (adenine-specific)